MRVSQAFSQSLKMLMVIAICASTTGCQYLKLGKTPPATKPGPQTGATSPAAAQIGGNWQVSYAVNGETRSAHMTINPSSGGFEGTGNDDADGQNFVIDTGFIAGNTIGFHKRYHVDENPNLPPIVYDGTFEMVSNPSYKGPYMHGTYKLDPGNGQVVAQGDWDAQKVDAQQAAGTGGPPQPQQPPPVVVDPSKPPDLSGKWNAGYEYEFKTFHSRMFLEQDGTKITGHGADNNTNESYQITGVYTFPNIKIIHKYPVLKLSKGKTKPARNLEFRGKVEVVNEPEYQGPRMVGKNIGGGDWMAEEVR
ncbi:MAG: hypothetical protein JSS83_24200 [Cyanobacteria bacterium SZAS LIN-3]|nr:hypothetical protein [Cyanobacteria bacterium SZAS LIN-3]